MMHFLSGLRLLPVVLMVLLLQRPQDFVVSSAGFDGLHSDASAWSEGAPVAHTAVLPLRPLPPVPTLDDRPEVQKESRYRYALEGPLTALAALGTEHPVRGGADPTLLPSYLRPIRC
ncbi:MAG: hypothetical protein O3C45_06040 [Bacteroidetes bacterium]|nr:hypothetical protein [Bacteroidota bacterium]